MLAIAAEMAVPLTVLSSLPRPAAGPSWVHLPGDDSGQDFLEPTANGTWHWVPLHHPGLRTRMALIAEWIARAQPALLVVDVSVEVAGLARLLGVPTVLLAMRGDRSDRPHVTAYDSAHALIAPWAPEFGPSWWPRSWTDKTFHAGPITAPAGGRPIRPAVHEPRRILVLWGAGGDEASTTGFGSARVGALREAHPQWDWRFAGGTGEHRVDRAEVDRLLGWADVVITHAGQNAVAEVAAARTPAVVIADARPHGEQNDTAMTLAGAGIAVGLPGWPAVDDWPQLLDRALALGGAQWSRWLTPHGAQRAAAFLAETAERLRPALPPPAAAS
ncbi:glycosyltransferase [Nakamurella panacisegetis]|nr:glycosyltransferase [Nakamurella panacisegetis]